MSHKILIIDDDKELVEVAKISLEKENYKVLTANGGREGLEMAKKELPDLILLDFVMPFMNGYEFLRALKAFQVIEGSTMIPVFVITARDGIEQLFKFEGVEECLIKPLEFSELVEKIERCLGSHV